MKEKMDIHFDSHGSVCRGWLFKGPREQKSPCIILAHGFNGVKEFRLDAYAERFSNAGYHALVFDYRHYGSSDGEPRNVIDINKQHQDWHAAIKYARSIPAVNPEKIILWGTSFSGGHVLQVAVEDRGIAAVISQVPHMNGFASAMAAGIIQNLRLGFASIRDHFNRIFNRSPFYVSAIGRPGDLAAMTAPGEYEASRRLIPTEGNYNEMVAARIFLPVSRYSPGKLAPLLKVPWLVQMAEKDLTTPVKPAVKAASKAEKARLLTYECAHFDIYFPPFFDQVVNDQIQFLKNSVK